MDRNGEKKILRKYESKCEWKNSGIMEKKEKTSQILMASKKVTVYFNIFLCPPMAVNSAKQHLKF